ncbi:precorrin-6A/cobalt-precorrin-6A reductase [Pseudorhizobium tarimense]|uniref:Precorrin-6A/cobalt-precorrin-6A reductase n=1 Tax=Pseudorhizobium tarimense TaxID=1079109 RepID=A0ABV2H4S2_9HYPH|nr:cobalt-precorrin-6A reductase [Pseudorhizobium tarimense]MCJ8518768.1 cobalt-precorrin-6A reductase [Pseudorhizobium tarimense]
MKQSILILGGTAEARRLAEVLSRDARYAVELSLAGRTRTPVPHAVPVRTGGFGGAEGLAGHLVERGFGMLIDATHPYAARISANAAMASKISGVPLVALRRAPWLPQAGDRWQIVAAISDAVSALGSAPRQVFLTLGRQELLPFKAAPQHRYLIRSVDPVEPPLQVPAAAYLTDRGPFREEDEIRLLRQYAIDVIVAKNSGGPASYGKIAAARELGIDVILIDRPELPDVPAVENVEAMVDYLAHALPPL